MSPAIVSELEERKLRLEQYWVEYNNCQTQLEILDDSELEDRYAFEEAYYNLAGRMRLLLRGASVSHITATPSLSPSGASDTRESFTNVRLPKLELPKFSGKYEEWFPFHDTFYSLIHANASLSNIHKLQYLRAALTHEAGKVISSFEISDANYIVAWNLLKERYDNKRVIVQTHLRSIMELPVVIKENPTELRQIADGAARHIHALKALKRPIDTWDDLLVYLLSSKLDVTTAREWQLSLSGDELPTLKQFLDFLAHRCQVLESTGRLANTPSKGTSSRSLANNKQRVSCNAVVNTSCHYCQGEHSIYRCKEFLALSIPKRIAEVRSRKICANCLRSTSHPVSKCPSGNCRTCSFKHNTLLHSPSSSTASKSSSNPEEKLESSSPTPATNPGAVVTHALSEVNSQSVLLSTAVALIQDKTNSLQPCRLLLDSGSQVNFISRDFLNTLGLIPRSVNVAISGVNGTSTHSSQAVQVRLTSRLNSYATVIDCIVTDRVSDDLPAFTMKRTAFNLPRNVRLADPNFNTSSKIDMLVGADTFWNLVCIGQIKSSDKHPTLQKTRLGWILAGRLNNSTRFSQGLHSFHASVSNSELHNQLAKFWQIDEIQNSPVIYTQEHRICEQHFSANVSTNEHGRYIVKLPLKMELINQLGDSRTIALNRLRALEKRFRRNPSLKARYSEFMHEYISLGHMRPITESPFDQDGTYYLPHHCVMKDSPGGSKLRVVFDGSCRTDSGLSLNDAMMVGPVVQDDLVSILMRFRTYKYVLVADIIKMYRQILVHPSQTRLQRILWRDSPESNYTIYELGTVTYGTSAASYLATRCLLHLAERYADEYPLASLRVSQDFYVDDLLTGADTLPDALAIRDQAVQLLKSGSFELSKWGSNHPALLEGVSDHIDGFLSIDKNADFRILGINWNRLEDAFRFTHKPIYQSDAITKRSILSQASRLFDPLGLIGPVIMIAKLILQDLWQSGVDWDESIPQDLHTRWLRLKLQFSLLSQLQIPRCVGNFACRDLVQIHGFCDASQRAYGACVYVRTRLNQQDYQSNIICSRSRVAPLRTVSLPRLELCAALLLAQLLDKIRSALRSSDIRTFLWSDSTVALCWISSPPRKWSVFVSNRVGEIQRLTEGGNWRHVDSPNNPADLLSRGSLPSDLIGSLLWWHGPSFLKMPEHQWPTGKLHFPRDEIPEQKRTCAVVVSFDYSTVNDLLVKFSSLNKVCRILAYCFRFSGPRNSNPTTRLVGPNEILKSLSAVCRAVQVQCFSSEYNSLSRDRPIDRSSHLLSLSPFIGKDGLIRVGGRLKNSALSFDACHQIVLPRSHILTTRIIELEHRRNLHSGIQATMAAIRQRFWPISLRSVTRKVINGCITCFKARPRFSEASMGSLPAPRVNISRPFSHCGVDYAGPITLREGKRRNSRNHKAYIAVFVCFATKAVHLELVSDLTTDAFLAALKRLISRRGKPHQMYSDNATTFVGANRQIRELYDFLRTENVQDSIKSFLSEHHTAWNFIPPNAPHFGGLWEAAVKSVKLHLTRIVGASSLTFEEMQTVLCEVEAALNSRPLVPLSSDPNDLTFLSPGHFLIGSPLNGFPNRDLSDVNTNRLIRWQVLEQMRQHFWQRWSNEYLNSLQERHKWKTSKGQQLQPGQLVLIKQQGAAPFQWLTGRVEDLQLGSDGVARSATVKTCKGSYTRPLTKLAILPMS